MITDYQNDHCRFKVCHQRGQILSWQPRGQADVLWCTDENLMSLDKPIRGGIPLCWPWFLKGDSGDLAPSHGFARIADWRLVSNRQLEAGTHRLVYQLTSADTSSPHYPHDFCLTLEYLIGETLTMSMTLQAFTAAAPTPAFGAFHSYFNVGDIEQTLIEGLGSPSIDNLANRQRVQEPEQVMITGSTEKRFAASNEARQTVRILDKAHQRTIKLVQAGHSDVMLWSPWMETGYSLKDTHPDDYKHFVCVETAAISSPFANHASLTIFSDKEPRCR